MGAIDVSWRKSEAWLDVNRRAPNAWQVLLMSTEENPRLDLYDNRRALDTWQVLLMSTKNLRLDLYDDRRASDAWQVLLMSAEENPRLDLMTTEEHWTLNRCCRRWLKRIWCLTRCQLKGVGCSTGAVDVGWREFNAWLDVDWRASDAWRHLSMSTREHPTLDSTCRHWPGSVWCSTGAVDVNQGAPNAQQHWPKGIRHSMAPVDVNRRASNTWQHLLTLTGERLTLNRCYWRQPGSTQCSTALAKGHPTLDSTCWCQLWSIQHLTAPVDIDWECLTLNRCYWCWPGSTQCSTALAKGHLMLDATIDVDWRASNTRQHLSTLTGEHLTPYRCCWCRPGSIQHLMAPVNIDWGASDAWQVLPMSTWEHPMLNSIDRRASDAWQHLLMSTRGHPTIDCQCSDAQQDNLLASHTGACKGVKNLYNGKDNHRIRGVALHTDIIRVFQSSH
jgi:hypothetical protein